MPGHKQNGVDHGAENHRVSELQNGRRIQEHEIVLRFPNLHQIRHLTRRQQLRRVGRQWSGGYEKQPGNLEHWDDHGGAMVRREAGQHGT